MLFAECQRATKASSTDFKALKNSCVARASKSLKGLLKRATDTDRLFGILAENNEHCN